MPDWCDGIHDMPYLLFDRLLMARVFISYDEVLPKEEQPPKRIWLDTKKLKVWFEEVDRKREAKMKGDSSEIEGPVDRNPAAAELIVGG